MDTDFQGATLLALRPEPIFEYFQKQDGFLRAWPTFDGIEATFQIGAKRTYIFIMLNGDVILRSFTIVFLSSRMFRFKG